MSSGEHSPTRIRAVIFDLDGTIIDSEPLYERVDREFLLTKGVLLPDGDWTDIVGMGGREFVRSIKERFELTEEIDTLVAEKDELYLSRAASVEPFPRVVELIRVLYVHGYQLAVATSSRRVVLDQMLQQTGLRSYFVATASADDVRHLKPDPEIFLRVSEALGVQSEHCLVVEDSRYGVAAARAAGTRVVALPGPGQSAASYAGADMLVEGGAAAVIPQHIVSEFLPDGTLGRLSDELVKRFQFVIYDHAARNPRPMPWRETSDPYRILVSEFMLQQTQVSRVIPKYTAFLERFPTLESLADASLGEVLALWQGLGYNRRGKYLHSAARAILERYGGELPADRDLLVALPGVGEYTASAIMAFAFSAPVPVVETNIRRAIIHLLFPWEERVPETAVRDAVAAVIDRSDPRAWYYAFMDYGAYLSQILPNSNRRSAVYTRQSRFEGSVRQVRGQIVRLLLKEGPLTVRELEQRAPPTDERFRPAIDALVQDGMIHRDGELLRLP